MDKRGGLAKQLRSPLNMISRDDFLHDNDSSNDSAAVTKGLKSLIKEQSQSTLGIFFFSFFPSLHSDLLIIKASKKWLLYLNGISLLDFKMWIKFHFKLGPISITKSRKIRVTFSFQISGSWKFFCLHLQKGKSSLFFLLSSFGFRDNDEAAHRDLTSKWRYPAFEKGDTVFSCMFYGTKLKQKLRSVTSLFFMFTAWRRLPWFYLLQVTISARVYYAPKVET